MVLLYSQPFHFTIKYFKKTSENTIAILPNVLSLFSTILFAKQTVLFCYYCTHTNSKLPRRLPHRGIVHKNPFLLNLCILLLFHIVMTKKSKKIFFPAPYPYPFMYLNNKTIVVDSSPHNL